VNVMMLVGPYCAIYMGFVWTIMLYELAGMYVIAMESLYVCVCVYIYIYDLNCRDGPISKQKKPMWPLPSVTLGKD
jgi:hypothetical protein